MFCTNCGNQLPDGTKFCIHCGAPQEDQTPVYPVEEPAVESAPAEQTIFAPEAPQEPVQEAPVYEAPVYEAPVYEAPAYTDVPAAPVPKKKKKKTGIIIAIVLVVVLLAGAAAGVFFFLNHKNSTAYDDAVAIMEAGKYADAQAAFEELGSYEDAADMAENLKDYQAALKLLDEHKYEDALKAFKELGKFHDSKTYVESGVTYHKAKYILECANKADPAALEIAVEDPSSVTSDDATVSYTLYCAAAELFEGLKDHQDSAELASECWLGAAVVQLEWGNAEEAFRLQEKLNDEDAQTLQAQVEANSADSTLMTDLETALVIWLDDEGNYSVAEEVQKAYDHLLAYRDLYFVDSDLEALYEDFMDALEVQLDTVDSDGYVGDWVQFYEGTADMYYVCDRLAENYGFLSGSEWESVFIGYYETAAKYPIVEKSMVDQFYSVEAPWSSKGYYYAPYTNTTDYDLVLYITANFYDGEEYLESGDQQEISIPAGETVEIPLIPKTLKKGDWDGWTVDWWFELT